MIFLISAVVIGFIFMLLYRKAMIDRVNRELARMKPEIEAARKAVDDERARRRELKDRLSRAEDRIVLLESEVRVASLSDAPKPAGKPKGEDFSKEYASDWLIKNGKISMEQYNKAMARLAGSNHDFVGICLALGYINDHTAKLARQFKDPALKK